MSSLGWRHTPDSRRKMSEARMGNLSRLGQKRSPQERAKASASLTGRTQKRVECPHCQRVGGHAMRRWHFDACKLRSM